MKLILENTHVDYKTIEDLFYLDNEDKNIILIDKNKTLGLVKIHYESDLPYNEYIILNKKTIFLEEIKKFV